MGQILQGDCVEVLRGMAAGTFDACLCDPPYGLEFMGKAWDHGVPARETWAEVLRVLKPGGFMLAFGGTRTHHRLMCAIEDAGFEIRDCMMWLYGSGFPKSLDISKAIDKAARGVPQGGADPTSANHGKFKGGCSEDNERGRGFGAGPGQYMREAGETVKRELVPAAQPWESYGTALKPAYEPIIVAMKPCEGTFAENALKHGVAGLDIDGGRIESGARPWRGLRRNKSSDEARNAYGEGFAGSYAMDDTEVGRWPANVILDQDAAAQLDQATGTLTSGANPERRHSPKTRNAYGTFEGQPECTPARGADSGGASRFFYCAKASRSERGEGNTHPTVKPLKLCEYLARLILPPKRDTPRRLIVPFSGSGSEMIGATAAGWDEVVGIELNPDYCQMASARLAQVQPRLAFDIAPEQGEATA